MAQRLIQRKNHRFFKLLWNMLMGEKEKEFGFLIKCIFQLVEAFQNISRNLSNFRKHRLGIILDNFWKVYNIYMKIIFCIEILNQLIFSLIQKGNLIKYFYSISFFFYKEK
jgi:hypothetical protein